MKELLQEKEISEGALLRFLNELAAFEPCRHQQNHREDANQVHICSPVSLPGSCENCHQHHPSSQPVQTGDRHLVKQQHLEGRSSAEVIWQYAEFVDSVVRPNLPAFKEFLTSTNSASMFLQQQVASSGSFPKL